MPENATHSTGGGRLFAALIAIFFAVQFVLALGYPSDPRLFPLIVSAIGFVLAMALTLGFGFGEQDGEPTQRAGRRQLELAILAPPAFGFGLWLLGFWLATLVAIPSIAWLLGYRNRTVIAAVTVGVALSIGVLFPLVHVSLPHGLIFGRSFL
jgi:hypothetical protein